MEPDNIRNSKDFAMAGVESQDESSRDEVMSGYKIS